MRRRHRRRWWALAVLAATGGIGWACLGTGGAPTPSVLVVSVPAGSGIDGGRPARLPEGARLEVVDADGARVFAAGFAAAGSPAVASDGARVAFAGRRSEPDPDGLWIADADGSGIVGVPGLPAAAGAPAWLPDGRLVFTAAVEDGHALHVIAAHGEGLERLTFFPDGDDTDPAVLPDGRLVFAHREGDGEGAVLYTLHVDGTGIEGWHGTEARAVPRSRPRPVPGRAVVVTVPDGVARIDARRPFAPATLLAPGAASARPADDGWLVALAPADGRATWGVVRLAEGTVAPSPFRDAADRDEIDAVVVAPRPRPQGHLSLVKPEAATGRLLVVDARRGRDPAATAAVRTAVRARLRADGRDLGEVPLAADGSLFATVPADRALEIVLLDAAGRELGSSGPRFWVRPNESRACLGCHEHPGETPPNTAPLALEDGPVDLSRPGRSR